jgi:NAD-dependent SIR2 family protein deacetylase
MYSLSVPVQGWAALKNTPSFVFTSNVDGHFQKAGFNEAQVLECHGSINHLQCVGEFGRPCVGIWQAANDSDLKSLIIVTERLTAQSQLPKCPFCQGLARPNILMFDNYNWQPDRTEAQEDKFKKWQDDLFISSGHLKQKVIGY